MKKSFALSVLFAFYAMFMGAFSADAALTLTAGDSATTTPGVATSITGFQIVGPSASTTPVQLRSAHGTLSMSVTSGLTFDGPSSGSIVNFSGTIADINAALSTLRYTRNSTGSDTLEVSLVNKGEIFFTENGHLYKFISGNYTWSAARTAAQSLQAYGSSGYLVTITSEEENDFVSARLTGDGWIGASDSETEGTWKWVTGPEAGTAFWQGTSGGSTIGGRYQAWAGGEPNQAGDEDCAETYVSSGTWNDFPCSFTLGYVVEFGTIENLPTVVAQNISIVTADVPAVTSLSPSNGAVSVNPSANLSMTFSKAVSKQTGNILIYRTSDNSLVESIDVSGGQVSGNGTSTIVIDLTEYLDEGTRFYVVVPNTAFKDASNNFFDGITGTSTWSFITSDITAPLISGISPNGATTSATVTWQTNEHASTRMLYSVDTSYNLSTSEINTVSRVLNHEVSLSGLLSCTVYNSKVVSRDASGNTATSSSFMFVTTGCPGGSAPINSVSSAVLIGESATSTLQENGRSFIVQTPQGFTSASSSVVIKIQSMVADPVLATIGNPDLNKVNAAGIVFDVKALINNTTIVDSFDVPVTVSYVYTDEDISGIREDSLWMYHYANGTWNALDDCVVDTVLNSITCYAPHFSIFSIFGNEIMPASGGSSGKGTSIVTRVNNLISMGKKVEAERLKSEWHWLFPEEVLASGGNLPSETALNLGARDLEFGMTGDDVRALQKLLISDGYSISAGPTGYFGPQTKAALSSYQATKGIVPAAGYFGPITRAQMKTRKFGNLWW